MYVCTISSVFLKYIKAYMLIKTTYKIISQQFITWKYIVTSQTSCENQ